MIKLLIICSFVISYSHSHLFFLNKKTCEVELSTSFFHDSTNRLDIKEIHQKNTFTPIKPHINFGHTKGTVWLKLDLLSKEKGEYVIDYGLHYIDYIDVYYFKNNQQIRSYHTGNRREVSTRALESNTFIFPISFQKNETLTLYFKLQSSKTLLVPLSIQKKDLFFSQKLKEYIFSTIFYTILLIISLNSFIIYLITKKKIFKYHTMYLVGTFVFWFIYSGYNFFLIMPQYPRLNLILFHLGIFIITYVHMKYLTVILQSEKRFKKIRSILHFIVYKIMLPTTCLIIIAEVLEVNDTFILKKVLFTSMYLSIFLTAAFSMFIFFKKTRYISKLLLMITILESIMFLIFLSNMKITFYETEELATFLQAITVIKAISTSLFFGVSLKFYEQWNHNLKTLYKKHKSLEFENFKLRNLENVFKIIIHQWKQPLSIINSIALNIETKYHNQSLNNRSLSENINNIEQQTDYMSQTLDYFFDHLKTQQHTEHFNIYDALIESLNLLSSKLSTQNIHYKIKCADKKLTTKGSKKDYTQVILILISNAIDAFEINEKNHKEILFSIYSHKNSPIFAIKDNAGGIKFNPTELIFMPNVSSKETKNSGLGLYIAKNIVSSMQKEIIYKNITQGTRFAIKG